MAGYLAVLQEAYHALPDKFNSCRLVNGDQHTNNLSFLQVKKKRIGGCINICIMHRLIPLLAYRMTKLNGI
jgi:hypothetical protein